MLPTFERRFILVEKIKALIALVLFSDKLFPFPAVRFSRPIHLHLPTFLIKNNQNADNDIRPEND
jgi:hypothetical protein